MSPYESNKRNSTMFENFVSDTTDCDFDNNYIDDGCFVYSDYDDRNIFNNLIIKKEKFEKPKNQVINYRCKTRLNISVMNKNVLIANKRDIKYKEN